MITVIFYQNYMMGCASQGWEKTTNTVFITRPDIFPYLLLKVIVFQKWKFCHHLLSIKLFQTYIHLFFLLNTKEDFDEYV